MSILGSYQSILQMALVKDDSAIQPSAQFKYLEVQRWDIIMQHLWPRARFINCFDSVSDANCPNNIKQSDEASWMPIPEFWEVGKAGKNIQYLYKIQGITKDDGGNPVGGIMVDLFRTLTDQKVDSCVSDAAGNYLVYTPYPSEGHYCVATNGVNLAGSTVNTLIGS